MKPRKKAVKQKPARRGRYFCSRSRNAKLLQLEFDDRARSRAFVGEDVGDLRVDPVKVAGLHGFGAGLAVGSGYLQLHGSRGNDQVRPMMCVLGGLGTGRKFPAISAGAWVFADNGPGD